MKSPVLVVLAAVTAGVALASASVTGRAEQGQGARTVADHVYTDVQAARGETSYETACANCHGADLSGATGPSLTDRRFAQDFAGKDLKALYTKVAATMPRNAPGSLDDAVYLDIVAYVLRENGFPAGPGELTAEGLADIGVVPGRAKPLPPVGDFSYVEVVGCLTRGAENTWMLTKSSQPIAASPSSSPDGAVTPLGTGTLQLIDAMAYAPEQHAGQKMHVRGLLIKLPDEQRMSISAIEMVSPACRD